MKASLSLSMIQMFKMLFKTAEIHLCGSVSTLSLFNLLEVFVSNFVRSSYLCMEVDIIDTLNN